jgi:hypothetical protein
VLQLGNVSLLAELNDFWDRCEDLEARLAKVRSDSIVSIASLEAKIKSIEAHAMDVAATDEKCLVDFKANLVKDLAGLWKLYVRNVQGIRGICSLMSEVGSLAVDYIRRLSTEVAGLPEIFAGVNKNFISVAVEGALTMAGESVDLDTLQDATVESGADILPTGHDVQRATHAVSKKWWHSFGYNYVLATICTKLREVTADA